MVRPRALLTTLSLGALAACTLSACGSSPTSEAPIVTEPEVVRTVDAGHAPKTRIEDRDAGATEDGGGPSLPTCDLARSIGSVRGDAKGEPTLTTGDASAWLSVSVLETPGGALGGELSARITLEPPKDCDYDLFAYVNVEKNEPSCSKESGRSTKIGASPETITFRWGEGFFPNWADDSRPIAIEVRRVSGTCPPGATWSLRVEGAVPGG
jgi:hypothetical protein